MPLSGGFSIFTKNAKYLAMYFLIAKVTTALPWLAYIVLPNNNAI